VIAAYGTNAVVVADAKRAAEAAGKK